MGSLTQTLYEVRRLIGDRRPGDPVCVDTFLEELVDIATEELRDEIGMGLVKTTSFQSLSAGVNAYTVALPSDTVSIGALQELVLESTGVPLERKPLSFILAMRTNGSDGRGEPRYYAITEAQVAPLNDARKVTLDIYPSPVANDALTAYWEPVYERIESGGSPNYTTVIPFSKAGLTALRMRVAGKAILALPPESLARLQPPKTAAFGQDLLNQSSALAVAEFVRLTAGTVPDTIQRTR